MKTKLATFLTGALLFLGNVNAQTLDNFNCDASTLQAIEDNNYNLMLKLSDQSKYLLKISEDILAVSIQVLKAGENANVTYVNAMLRLSDDIGKMADRIGEMADRILWTEEQIGIMADRIILTQQIQSKNLALTEANLLKAQKNFQDFLLQLANSK